MLAFIGVLNASRDLRGVMDQEGDAVREVFPNVVGNGCLVKVKRIVM